MSYADWKVPADPDPGEILKSADQDRIDGNFSDSLKKQIWFHHHALEVDRSYYGVRLSYALESWHELSRFYEPAKKALLAESDVAEKKIKDPKLSDKDAFHDFSSINRELGREELIVHLFKWLDINNNEQAKKSFGLALPSLIKAKEYTLSIKYMNPEKDFSRMQKAYAQNLNLSKDPKFGDQMKEYAINSYTNEVTTLVALLVVNDRIGETKSIVSTSMDILNTEEHRNALEEALSGKVPNPWP